MAAETELKFDGWTVNRITGEIARDGKSSRLPQQPLRILLELADHVGEVVTREQLVKVLWPGGIVDFDNGLNVAVRKLRIALDDVGDVPRYIETLPRVGYRFMTPGGRTPQPAIEAILKLPARARLALVLTLVVLAVGVAGSWWWLSAPSQPLAAVEQVADPGESKHVPSVRARELYLQGLHLRSRRDGRLATSIIEVFEATLREDPNYPEAWAALGDAYMGAVFRQMILPGDGVPKARAAAQRAIELDDEIVEAHNLLGQILMDYDRDFAGAEREYQRSMQINDRSARLWHHYSMWYAHQGRVEEALEAMRRARELEPMTLLYSMNYAFVLYNARRYEDTIVFLQPLVEANPKLDQARSVLARALMATGDLQGAARHLELRDEVGAFQGDAGVLHAKSGRRDAAMREVARLDARGREGFPAAYEQAAIYTALGDLDAGCAALERALTDGSILINWMRLDPRMDGLRGRKCYSDVEKQVYAPKGPAATSQRKGAVKSGPFC